MPSHDSRETAHALGEDRISLVRHGRAALLLLAKWFEDLPDLAALEVADLGGDPLEGTRHGRQREHEGRVHVARDDLSGDRVGAEAELSAHVLLDPRVDGGVRADGAAHATHGDLFGGALEPGLDPVKLGHPAGDLEAERGRLGNDAVSASGRQRSSVLNSKACGRLTDCSQVAPDDRRRLHQLKREGGVVEVLASHAHVHVARLGLSY